MAKLKRLSGRKRRHVRLRKKVQGTAERPRLAVFRSAKHTYAQLIDDTTGHTLASASTVDAELRSALENSADIDAARAVGRLIGERAQKQHIESVVFDRGGNLYHGRVAALAEGAREAGLQF